MSPLTDLAVHSPAGITLLLAMNSNGTLATTVELVSDCAAIRPDSNSTVTGSIHFALFINSSLKVGKLAEEDNGLRAASYERPRPVRVLAGCSKPKLVARSYSA